MHALIAILIIAALVAAWRGVLYLRDLLRWSRALTEWEQEERDRIGGVVASIEMDARIWEACDVPTGESWDLLTFEMLGAGIIDDAEATRRNLERWEL